MQSGSRLSVLFVFLTIIVGGLLIAGGHSQARADYIDDDPSNCGMCDQDPDDPNQSDSSEAATPPAPIPTPAAGQLAVLPTYGVSFSGGQWTVFVRCSDSCSGTVTFQSHRSRKVGKKKFKVFTSAPYSADSSTAGLIVPVSNAQAKVLKKKLAKVKTIFVVVSPTAGGKTFYKLALKG